MAGTSQAWLEEVNDALLCMRTAPGASRARADAIQVLDSLVRGSAKRVLLALGCGDDTDDVYQAALLKILRSIDNFQGGHPGAGWKWIRTILVSNSRDHFQSRANTQDTVPLEDDDPRLVAEDQPEANVLRAERSRWLQRALADLPAASARLLVDWCRGLPASELAKRHLGTDSQRNRNVIYKRVERLLGLLRGASRTHDRVAEADRASAAVEVVKNHA